jgi:hypothetical protein
MPRILKVMCADRIPRTFHRKHPNDVPGFCMVGHIIVNRKRVDGMAHMTAQYGTNSQRTYVFTPLPTRKEAEDRILPTMQRGIR